MVGLVTFLVNSISPNPLFAKLAPYAAALQTIGLIGAFYYMRKNNLGEQSSEITEETRKKFQDVPAATMDRPPKPIDFTGNVFQHNEEAFKDDFRQMGIDPDDKSKD